MNNNFFKHKMYIFNYLMSFGLLG